MYTLKSTLKRGMTLSAALALVVASLASTVTPAFADSLNPLTKRSLTLSSSSPGWADTDGSGNSTYAPPNSGTNGFKTGNTFEFNVSTNSSTTGPGATSAPIKAMSFQYCTTSAGDCTSPGNNASHGPTPTATTSDLNVAFPSPVEVATGASDFDLVVDSSDGSVKAVPGATNPLDPSDVTGQFAAKNVTGNYVVYYNNAGTWTQSSGWNMAVSNVEDGAGTGQNNYITLWNTDGLGIPSDTTMKVVFFGTNDDYITNPGDGAFFVKINTYKAFTDGTPYNPTGPVTAVAPTLSAGDIIDGGVTVANVMNQSIQITTKVLETMDFSVGTVDPDTLASDGSNPGTSDLYKATGNDTHGPCDAIAKSLNSSDPLDKQNVLQLGNQAAESSLSTAATYSTHSYWRLSSNSSAGATVYYSGSTLSNTENDQIAAIGVTAAAPHRGAPQFGLAIADGTRADNNGTSADGTTGQNYAVDFSTESDSTKGLFENGADNGKSTTDATFATDMTAGGYTPHPAQLWPLIPEVNYDSGAGVVNGPAGALGTGYTDTTITSPNTKFAFDPQSQTIPTPIASENSQVVDCVTAKMRYIANIAATTPAGIYTTKINYIAAPQY